MRGYSFTADAMIRRSAPSVLMVVLLLGAMAPSCAGVVPAVANSSVSTYIVVFNDTPQSMALAQSASDIVTSSGGQVTYRFSIINGMAVTMPDSMAGRLESLPNVKYIEKEQEVHILLNDSVPQIGADQVWAEGYTGSGVKVAVIDTGVDAGHPDLDGDKVVAWVDFVKGKATPYDDNGHGTHVSSIVAGTGNASGGNFTGVAPGASLMVAKVLGASGSGTDTTIVKGIDWAVQNGAQVISMSLGSDRHSQAMDDAVANATAHGIAVVVAAGNSGPGDRTIQCPGDAPEAITVGAVDKSDVIASFSSRGPNRDGSVKPDVVNVGVRVIAASGSQQHIGTPLPDNTYYMPLSGTSMATPMTSGVIALMLEKNPSLTPAQAKYILEKTAKPLGASSPNYDYGWGRVQAKYAVDNATYSSLYMSDSLPASPGTILDTTPSITITMKNDGAYDWSNESNVTMHALGDAADIGDAITTMPAGLNITPGQEYTWAVPLNVTASHGTYDLRYQMFANDTPFGDTFSKTIRVNGSVEPGTLQLNNSSYYVSRTSGSAIIWVNRTNGLDNTVTVNYTTGNGNGTAGIDYTSTSGTLTFVQDQQYAYFDVPILNDGVYRGVDKTVLLSLSDPGGNASLGTSSAILTIIDDNPQPVLQFSASKYTTLENQTNFTVTVTRTANLHGPVSVNYSVGGGNATPGVNYVAATGTLNFSDGQTTKNFNVTILADYAISPDKSINLSLSNLTNGSLPGTPSAAILTIKDSTVNFTYHLKKGWNMISVPFSLENDSVDSFFPSTVIANLTDMWYYNNDTWIYYSGTRGYSPKYAHLTNLTPGKGYWVKLSNNSTFTIYGIIRVSGMPAASSGWTMFGVEGLNSFNAVTAYPSNKDMWYYDNGQWYYYSNTRGYSSKYPHLANLDPGKGYWVHY